MRLAYTRPDVSLCDVFLAASLQAPPPERKRLRKAGEAEANEGGAADTRNPELPTSVPMPSSTAQVTNGHIAAFLDAGLPCLPVLPESCLPLPT